MTRFLAKLFGQASNDFRPSESIVRYDGDEKISDAHRVAASAASERAIEFDLRSMERALASPRIQLPSGLTPEQKLEFMLASVAERK